MQLADLLKTDVLAKLSEASATEVPQTDVEIANVPEGSSFSTTAGMLAFLRQGGMIVPSQGFDREGFFIDGGRIRERFMVISDAGIPFCYNSRYYTDEEFLMSDKFRMRQSGKILFWQKKEC